jgi:DnaK suppressor protein
VALALEPELVAQSAHVAQQVLRVDAELVENAPVLLGVHPLGQLAVRLLGFVVLAALAQQLQNLVLGYLHLPLISGRSAFNLDSMAKQQTDIGRLLRGRLEEIQARLAELARPPEAGAGIGFGKRIGDGTSEAISRRNEISVGNSLLITEEKLKRALAKLDEGSYGRCDRCGGPIAPARLEAVPESTLCIDCAR